MAYNLSAEHLRVFFTVRPQCTKDNVKISNLIFSILINIVDELLHSNK